MDSYLSGIANGAVVSLPLVGMNVKGHVLDYVSEITIEKRFENVEDVPIEAVYILPLDEGASVHKFNVFIDGKKLEGIVEEKETALNEYEDNIAKGHSSFLLEQVDNSQNLFKTSIGNIGPRREVLIVVGYVTELQLSANQLELVLPSPKTSEPSLHGENPLNIPNGFNVDISIEMTSEINSVTSPSHPAEITLTTPTSASAILEYSHEECKNLPAAFVLNIQLLEPHKPMLCIKDQVAMLTVFPDLARFDLFSEIIFLVDRSGSMRGEKIEKTRNTMQIFLRSLPMGVTFNIVGFGSTFKHLFSESRDYDDESLSLATKYVEEMGADLGGTVLEAPLRKILESEATKGIPRQIFLLTDGEVDNPSACIELVKEHAKSTRIFTFGIHGASPALVRGIAEAGNGKAEMIYGSEDLENRVLAQLNRALQPALTNMLIDWGNDTVQQTPKNLPLLFGGSKLTTFAYLPPNFTLGKVEFTAQINKETFSFAIDATTCNSVDDNYNFIKIFAARSSMRDLEGEISALRLKGENSSKLQEKVVQLSTEHNILCGYTAFLVIDENFQAVYNTMLKKEENPFTRSGTGSKKGNWVMVDGQMCKVVDSTSSKTGKHGSAKVHMVLVDQAGNKKEMIVNQKAVPAKLSLSLPKRAPAAASKTPQNSLPVPDSRALRDIIMHQRAAGNFKEDVLGCIGEISVANLYANVPTGVASQPSPALDEVLISAFVCGLMRVTFASREAQWALVEKKLQTWLKKDHTGTFGASFDWVSFSVQLAQGVLRAALVALKMVKPEFLVAC
eukprot:Phypoly_transcript_02945.p1 GENE.Phypoly_transcript_02945~~Phypoly_transcript_02945.p1  ORF type:complete len:789 (+),score=142.25 Phypoly_transcript_02945:155-2521(+)